MHPRNAKSLSVCKRERKLELVIALQLRIHIRICIRIRRVNSDSCRPCIDIVIDIDHSLAFDLHIGRPMECKPSARLHDAAYASFESNRFDSIDALIADDRWCDDEIGLSLHLVELTIKIRNITFPIASRWHCLTEEQPQKANQLADKMQNQVEMQWKIEKQSSDATTLAAIVVDAIDFAISHRLVSPRLACRAALRPTSFTAHCVTASLSPMMINLHRSCCSTRRIAVQYNRAFCNSVFINEFSTHRRASEQ